MMFCDPKSSDINLAANRLSPPSSKSLVELLNFWRRYPGYLKIHLPNAWIFHHVKIYTPEIPNIYGKLDNH